MTKNILIRDLKLSSDVQNALYDMGILIDESIDRFKKLKDSDFLGVRGCYQTRVDEINEVIRPHGMHLKVDVKYWLGEIESRLSRIDFNTRQVRDILDKIKI
jgi:Fe2+ transport system protein FeoA